jgi:hypothetical protein
MPRLSRVLLCNAPVCELLTAPTPIPLSRSCHSRCELWHPFVLDVGWVVTLAIREGLRPDKPVDQHGSLSVICSANWQSCCDSLLLLLHWPYEKEQPREVKHLTISRAIMRVLAKFL